MYRVLIHLQYNNNLRMHLCICRLFPFSNCFCLKIWSFYFVFVKIAFGGEGGGGFFTKFTLHRAAAPAVRAAVKT